MNNKNLSKLSLVVSAILMSFSTSIYALEETSTNSLIIP